jgi:hypothetical protein
MVRGPAMTTRAPLSDALDSRPQPASLRLLGGVALASILLAPAACEPAYLDTIAPDDASFSLSCASTCGESGQDDGIMLDVTFVGHGRQFSACCSDVPALRAQLKTIEDFWCDGLDVPPKKVGDLVVGVTESKVSQKRGATLDHGDGYVAFNCDGWLLDLQKQLRASECCRGGR